jgi:hypothetical protein
MDEFTSLFTEVADALGVDSVSIIEKDHYIVELLQILKSLTFGTHQLYCVGKSGYCAQSYVRRC